jgi:ribose 5-phosphate isomerase
MYAWNTVLTATLYHTQEKKNRRSDAERGCVLTDTDNTTDIILDVTLDMVL